MISNLWISFKKCLIKAYLLVTRFFFALRGIPHVLPGTEVLFAHKRWITRYAVYYHKSDEERWNIMSKKDWSVYPHFVPTRKLSVASNWYNVKNNFSYFWDWYNTNCLEKDIESIASGNGIKSIQIWGAKCARNKQEL